MRKCTFLRGIKLLYKGTFKRTPLRKKKNEDKMGKHPFKISAENNGSVVP